MKSVRVKTSVRWIQALCVVAAGAWLAGCSSVALDENKVPVETRTPSSVTPGGGAAAGAAPQSQVANVDLTKQAAKAADRLPRVLYFVIERCTVQDEVRP